MKASATSNQWSGPENERPFVLHSHHYHAALLRALYEASEIDATRLLDEAIGACDEVFAGPVESVDEAGFSLIEARFAASGLGALGMDSLGADGTGMIELRDSHSAAAWLRRYPPAERPICGIAAATLARSLSAYAGEPRQARELECAATGADRCLFEVSPGGLRLGGVGTGPRGSAGRDREGRDPGRVRGTRESAQIREVGTDASETRAIRVDGGPGSPLVALPIDFYAAITHLFETEIPRLRGAKFANLPGILLTEAAHRNGFHLFAEALQAEDSGGAAGGSGVDEGSRLERLLSLLGSLQWGGWRIQSFLPGERLIVRAADSYEAQGHCQLFGQGRMPHCTVAGGAMAALMNLLYRSPSLPPPPGQALTFYNTLFRNPHSFRAAETRCVAMGDSVCELVVNPLTA